MKWLIFFFAVFLICILGFAVAVEGLRATLTQVRWNYNADRSQWNATIFVSNGEADNDFSDWIQIERLVHWGILKLFGQIEDLSYGS